MMETIAVVSLTLVFAVLFWWAFHTLPGEGWQIMATVPLHKHDSGRWTGLNLTWYGFFSASAYVLAAAVYLVLTASLGVPLAAAGAVLIFILGICAPAAKVLARVIENKNFTFTVGGASFVGIITAPLLINVLATLTGWSLPVFPILAAIAVAYSFGEGVGRLACVSFGCCYGRPLSDFGPFLQGILDGCSFTFTGKTKKIAYESGLDGQKVIPVQAFSAVVNSLAGLLGTVLFFASHFVTAFIVTVAITQGWRFFVEFLRADYRGQGRISAYQKMNIGAILYAMMLIVAVPPAPSLIVDIATGLRIIWNPIVILTLQGLWVACFLYTGLSKVTGATMDFFVHRDRI
ncbi:MAG: prolipoprotein diacylglyceryl transferase [Syntrophales bacterium]|nr:prolipoprotein diacylglyceryl transferase [Syntrophales bacterium]